MSALYRIQQFIRAAGSLAGPREGYRELPARCLSPEAARLFQGMSRYDQQHALNVCVALERQGYIEPDLLAAALLHDVGKSVVPGARLRLWHRVAVVLMQVLWPSLLGRLAQEKPGSWQQPFYIHLHHAAIGAEAAKQTGCSVTTVELIRRHEDPPEQAQDPLLVALQAADGEN